MSFVRIHCKPDFQVEKNCLYQLWWETHSALCVIALFNEKFDIAVKIGLNWKVFGLTFDCCRNVECRFHSSHNIVLLAFVSSFSLSLSILLCCSQKGENFPISKSSSLYLSPPFKLFISFFCSLSLFHCKSLSVWYWDLIAQLNQMEKIRNYVQWALLMKCPQFITVEPWGIQSWMNCILIPLNWIRLRWSLKNLHIACGPTLGLETHSSSSDVIHYCAWSDSFSLSLFSLLLSEN